MRIVTMSANAQANLSNQLRDNRIYVAPLPLCNVRLFSKIRLKLVAR